MRLTPPSLVASRFAQLCALVGAAGAGACTAEPIYLGVSEEGLGPEAPVPYECEPERCFIDPGLDASEVEAVYDGSGAVLSPEVGSPVWHYPLPESVHPSNLGLLTLHFAHNDPTGQIFELILGDDSRQRRFYFPCLSAGGNGCLFRVPERFWYQTATAFAGEQVELKLRAGGSEGISAPSTLTVSFSPSPVVGGLYYWSAELEGVYRLVFGGREAVPYIVPRTPSNTEDCAGCHAVSRDGSTIAFSQGSSEPGVGVLENAAFDGSLKVSSVTALESPSIDPTPDAPSDTGMMTLSRDGSKVVSAFDFGLALRDTASGSVLDQVSELGGQSPFFPEFSPDDQTLVVTLTGTSDIDSEIGVRRGAIATVSLVGDEFGEISILVPESTDEAHYYPTWSPDGNYVAFVSGPAGSRSYDQEDSLLRLVSLQTGQIFDLDRATGPRGFTSTWPKFAPFLQCPDGGDSCGVGERIFFLTYSSKRPYGLVANLPGSFIRSQLWMSAIDLSRTGTDPSSAPLWVPYQSPDTRNHLGYWTEALRCNETYGCGFGQRCDEKLGKCEIVVR